MLFEFSGPSGVGKTTFCRYLLSRYPTWISLRRSTEDRMLCHRHVFLALLGSREISRFPKMREQLKQLSSGGNAYLHRKLPSPGKLTIENMIFLGAKVSSRIWLLDQGRFQLQSWLPRSVIGDQERLSACMSELIVFADVLVIFRCCPSLVVSRVKARGDYCDRDALSKERGFSDLLDMSEFDYSLASAKLRTALAAGSDSVLIDLQSNKIPPTISIHCGEGNDRDLQISNARQEMLDQLSSDFLSWWAPG